MSKGLPYLSVVPVAHAPSVTQLTIFAESAAQFNRKRTSKPDFGVTVASMRKPTKQGHVDVFIDEMDVSVSERKMNALLVRAAESTDLDVGGPSGDGVERGPGVA